jgi:hypothetical protein
VTLLQQGDTAPGIGGAQGGVFDVTYGNSNDPRMDSAGDLVFFADLQDGRTGIWYQSVGGSLVAVARSGENTPGPAEVFTAFERPTLNANGGQVAFRGFMAVNGVDGGNGIWCGDPTAPSSLPLIVRTGDTSVTKPTMNIPAGSSLNSIWSPFSNASGKLAFRVSLVDGGGHETRGIMTDTNGTLAIIAKAGDTAPGLGADTFNNFDHPIIGDGNQAAFSASTAGGVDGIWKQAAGGGALSPVLKVGDIITSDGVTKTIVAFVVVGTATSDRLNEITSMDAAGQILVWVTYDTGASSMLLTAP